MSPTPHPSRRTLAVTLATALAGLALLAGCTGPAPDPLAPLAGMAASAMGETEQRLTRAHQFLADEVLPHPAVSGLFDGTVPEDAPPISWGTTPYIAVGAVDAQGELIDALPSAGEGIRKLLTAAARGPEVGDLLVIPNTFSFVLPMRQPVPGHDGAALTALLDVDRVLVQGVLQPVAEAAGGFAFLADGNHNVVLSTLPDLSGRAMGHFDIPVPAGGERATATVTINGRAYDVGTATASGGRGWVIGVGVAAGQTGDAAPA
jgi:hypothetical protein